MNATKYCMDCGRYMTPKGTNPWIFWILAVIGVLTLWAIIGPILIILAIVYLISSKDKCPICNGRNFKEGK